MSTQGVGLCQRLKVDYGSRVRTGQLMATLDIPELQSQLLQDDANIKTAQNQVTHAENEVSRSQASTPLFIYSLSA